MDELTITRISMLCTVLGMVMLFYVLKHSPLPEYSRFADDEDVMVHGRLTKVRELDNAYLVDIITEEKISLFLEKSRNPPSKGSNVSIKARVTQEDGKKDFHASSIEIVK